MLQHRQVEAGVVRDEHGPLQQREHILGDRREPRCVGDVLVADPVHRRRVSGNRTRRLHQGHVSVGLDPVSIQPHHRQRHDLVHRGIRPRRLTIEHRVGSRDRNIRPPPNLTRKPLETPPGVCRPFGGGAIDRDDDRFIGHASRMSPVSDGRLTALVDLRGGAG